MVLGKVFFHSVLWTIAVLLAIPIIFGNASGAFFTEFFFTQTGAFFVFVLVFLVVYNFQWGNKKEKGAEGAYEEKLEKEAEKLEQPSNEKNKSNQGSHKEE